MSEAKTSTTLSKAGEVRDRHRQFLFPCAPPYYQNPLVLVRGEGAVVEDAEGRKFLDLFSGILTTSVGHCHPEVVERVLRETRIALPKRERFTVDASWYRLQLSRR